jgi:hypothetical protein
MKVKTGDLTCRRSRCEQLSWSPVAWSIYIAWSPSIPLCGPASCDIENQTATSSLYIWRQCSLYSANKRHCKLGIERTFRLRWRFLVYRVQKHMCGHSWTTESVNDSICCKATAMNKAVFACIRVCKLYFQHPIYIRHKWLIFLTPTRGKTNISRWCNLSVPFVSKNEPKPHQMHDSRALMWIK